MILKATSLLLFLSVLGSPLAHGQQIQQPQGNAKILDGREVQVTHIELKPVLHPDGTSDNTDIFATINFPDGCGMTDALVVVSDRNFNYHIYNANKLRRDTGHAHCGAFFIVTQELKVDTYGGPRPNHITVNGVEAP